MSGSSHPRTEALGSQPQAPIRHEAVKKAKAVSLPDRAQAARLDGVGLHASNLQVNGLPACTGRASVAGPGIIGHPGESLMTRARGILRPGDSAQPEPHRVEAEIGRPSPTDSLPAASASVGEIHFPHGNSAKRVTASPEADPAEMLGQLGIPLPKALLLLIGGADEMDPGLGVHLQQLFGRGLVPAVECDGSTPSINKRQEGGHEAGSS